MSFPPDASDPPPARAGRTRVWDLPTRSFHWLLAAAVVALIVTGRSGLMDWHFRLGYAVLALLMFRLVWGFVGGRWSRFGSFLRGPRAVLDHLRGRAHPDHLIGHTPLGAMSVLAMLLILGLQVATGLMADDEIAAVGPLAQRVPQAVSGWATAWHAKRGQWVVMALIALHVLAIAYHVVVRRHRLIAPMVTGDKLLAHGAAAPSRDDTRTRLLALALFIACIALSAWLGSLPS
jgi:cytochrome b